MALTIEKYVESDEKIWDEFVLKKSMNGTFLQTRKFINYHKNGKFRDCSLCIRKEKELVATVLACEIEESGKKVFYAHKGTTFGGITISEIIYDTSSIDAMMNLLMDYWRNNSYDSVYLKMVPYVYQNKNTDLLDYFLYKNKFQCFNELNFYMNLDRYRNDILSQMTSSKRRDYRYSLKNDLKFRKLNTKEQIRDYYNVLLMNLEKLNLPAVHSLEDLYDLKYSRFPEKMDFFGVYYREDNQDKMIAGSMLFYFDNNVVHTQYLSSDNNYLKLFPMDYLIFNLLNVAVSRGAEKFTFGICTEDQGRYLNLGLSMFKEGFGAKYCINRSYMLQI